MKFLNLNFKSFFSVFLIILLLTTGCAEFKDIFTNNLESNPRKKTKDQSYNGSSSEELQYTYYIVKENDTFDSIADEFNVKVSQIKELNGYDVELKPEVGDELIVPVSKHKSKQKPKKKKKKEVSSSKPSSSSSLYIWPVNGKFTSGFGKRGGKLHDGIDVSAPRGTEVIASRTGKVIHAGRLSGYGNLVVLKHDENYFTAYAHLTKIFVKKGAFVKQGKKVGTVGNTGKSRGPHLHFEIRYKTKPIDPLKFLPKRKAN